MRVRLYSGEGEAPVGSFVGKFAANVCAGIAASLKSPEPVKDLRFELEGDDVRIHINGTPVALDMSKGFAKTIVRDTLRGMIHHLRGMNSDGVIRIEVEFEPQP